MGQNQTLVLPPWSPAGSHHYVGVWNWPLPLHSHLQLATTAGACKPPAPDNTAACPYSSPLDLNLLLRTPKAPEATVDPPPPVLPRTTHLLELWIPAACTNETSQPPRPGAATHPCSWCPPPLDPGLQHIPVCPTFKGRFFLTEVSP